MYKDVEYGGACPHLDGKLMRVVIQSNAWEVCVSLLAPMNSKIIGQVVYDDVVFIVKSARSHYRPLTNFYVCLTKIGLAEIILSDLKEI